ncbi:MAG: hypothetical protein JW891_09625 [Candidatus Lokiarchaeota archaeon]|nr:hypothetical protein [Candidatus Lokiarchaeota archaeon]
MTTIKEKVIETIKRLPENANYDDIMESIYIQQAIFKGLDQLDNGESLSHEEVKKRFEEWLR